MKITSFRPIVVHVTKLELQGCTENLDSLSSNSQKVDDFLFAVRRRIGEDCLLLSCDCRTPVSPQVQFTYM